MADEKINDMQDDDIAVDEAGRIIDAAEFDAGVDTAASDDGGAKAPKTSDNEALAKGESDKDEASAEEEPETKDDADGDKEIDKEVLAKRSPEAKPQLPELPAGSEKETDAVDPRTQTVVGKSHRGTTRILLRVLFFAAVFAGGALAAFMYVNRAVGPEAAFDRMLENNLNTATFNQTYRASAASGEVNFSSATDLTDIARPRLAILINNETPISESRLLNIAAEMLVYEDDVYLRYTDLSVVEGDEARRVQSDDALNQWVFLVRDGQTQGEDVLNLRELSEILATPLGDFIIGDFSNSQDGQILDFIRQNQIYSYNPATVATEVVNGQDAYRYDVTIQAEQLRSLQRLVGEMAGLNQDAIESLVQAKTGVERFTVWVSQSDQRLIKTEMGDQGSSLVVEYGQFGEPVSVTPPVVVRTIDEIQINPDDTSF